MCMLVLVSFVFSCLSSMGSCVSVCCCMVLLRLCNCCSLVLLGNCVVCLFCRKFIVL